MIHPVHLWSAKAADECLAVCCPCRYTVASEKPSFLYRKRINDHQSTRLAQRAEHVTPTAYAKAPPTSQTNLSEVSIRRSARKHARILPPISLDRGALAPEWVAGVRRVLRHIGRIQLYNVCCVMRWGRM